MNPDRYRKFLDTHRLTIAICLAITVALLLTVINVSLYIRSGASRLDLSRPGYEKVRNQIGETQDEPFSASGPINEDVIDEFQGRFTKRRTTIDSLSPFTGEVLDDANIGLFSTGTNQ